MLNNVITFIMPTNDTLFQWMMTTTATATTTMMMMLMNRKNKAASQCSCRAKWGCLHFHVYIFIVIRTIWATKWRKYNACCRLVRHASIMKCNYIQYTYVWRFCSSIRTHSVPLSLRMLLAVLFSIQKQFYCCHDSFLLFFPLSRIAWKMSLHSIR